MSLKLMVYRLRIKDAGFSKDGKALDFEIPVVDCPKPNLGKAAAIQNCLECKECEELGSVFVVCNCSKQEQDQMFRNKQVQVKPPQPPQHRPTEVVPREEPDGVFHVGNKN